MKGRVNKEISKYYENKLNLNNKITTKLRIWQMKKKKIKKKKNALRRCSLSLCIIYLLLYLSVLFKEHIRNTQSEMRYKICLFVVYKLG